MKQEIPPTITETKPRISHSTTPSRLRASSKPKDSPRPEAVSVRGVSISASISPAPRARAAKSAPQDPCNAPRTRRSLLLNKPKSGEDVMGSQKGRELEDAHARLLGRSVSRPVVDHFALAPPRRRTHPSCRTNEEEDPDGKMKEFQDKLDSSDTLIKNLQSEVVLLKADLDKTRSMNAELQSQNRKLTHDLAAAEAKIASLTSRDQGQEESVAEYQTPNFKDVQKLIANKLEPSKVKKEAISEPTTVNAPSTAPLNPILVAVDTQRKVPAYPSAPPPPPPPPPPLPLPRSLARTATAQKAPALVEFYHSLTKREGKKDSPGSSNYNKPVVISAHSSIVGEIQNRSAHLLAIKADIETKGGFVNSLIQKVLAAAYTDIEDVLKFVDWLDSELSSLADERAVLKHFKWPERKADAMREAAIEYRDLKLLECEISSYKDDINTSCEAALKKMASLLDKSERSMQRLIKLRNSVLLSYQDYKIPTDWMLDSGIASKIKQASLKLAKMYMKRVTIELESVRNSERESAQAALLLQGVHFAYRAHQFAGGLDSETLCAFEEIRQRVPGHLGGSRELLVGMSLS